MSDQNYYSQTSNVVLNVEAHVENKAATIRAVYREQDAMAVDLDAIQVSVLIVQLSTWLAARAVKLA